MSNNLKALIYNKLFNECVYQANGECITADNFPVLRCLEEYAEYLAKKFSGDDAEFKIMLKEVILDYNRI